MCYVSFLVVGQTNTQEIGKMRMLTERLLLPEETDAFIKITKNFLLSVIVR